MSSRWEAFSSMLNTSWMNVRRIKKAMLSTFIKMVLRYSPIIVLLFLLTVLYSFHVLRSASNKWHSKMEIE